MYPETWNDFISTLNKALPVLSPANKKKIKQIIQWAQNTKPRGRNPDKGEVEWTRGQLTSVIGSSTGTVRTDLSNAWGFLGWFLRVRDLHRWVTRGGCSFWGGHWWGNSCHDEPWADSPDNYTDAGACKRAGYYWWNGSCHSNRLACRDYRSTFDCEWNGCYWYNNRCNGTPYEEPPPPPPPPPPKPCNEITSQSECLARSCYWYQGACHKSPEPTPEPLERPFEKMANDTERFCKTIPIWDIPKTIACHMLKDIFRLLDDFLEFTK